MLTFQSLLLASTNRFKTSELTFCPHCICLFCIYLRTNSDVCPIWHKLIGFYNRDEKCLLRGTNWGFKFSSLRFVFKGLTTVIYNLCVLYLSQNKQRLVPLTA